MSDIAARLTAALADRYTIERELGAGGMATVYLAEDLKHKRHVAVKVLRPELAAVLGAERFVQEITTTANLQHPHILPLFDSGEADSFLYYVMPYVEGETLRDKLNRETQLGIDEALQMTCDVADALDYAHRHGVIHRDIKPENILLQDGRPMVADFGIALAVSAAAGGRMTETGLSLGTPHYMSPEQATAEKDLTNRSDIYSLASVLYEMLTGEPPHTRGSAQQIIMKIVADPARPVAELRKTVPPNVAAAVGKAVEKLAADRFESAKAFAEALRNPSFSIAATGLGASPADAAPPVRRVPVLGMAGVAAAVVGGVLVGMLVAPRGATGPTVFDVGLPDSAGIAFTKGNPWGTGWTAFNVASSGEFLVYIADAGPTTMLWYRSLRDDTARPIPGTEGAYQLFLSPDDTEVAFVAENRLKKVALDEPGVFTVGDVSQPNEGRWLVDGRILIADSSAAALAAFDPTTGQRTSVTIPAGQGCGLPTLNAGSDYAICASGDLGGVLVAVDMQDGSVRELRNEHGAVVMGSSPWLVDDRYILYLSTEGYLYAAPLDDRDMTVGRAAVVRRGIRREGTAGAGQYGLTASGTLVYAPGPNMAAGQLVEAGDGDPRPLAILPGTIVQFDLTRDGTAMAAILQTVNGQELWVYDVATGRGDRLHSGFLVTEPRWDPTGTSIVVQSRGTYEDSIVVVRMDRRAATTLDTLTAAMLLPSHYVSDDLVIGSVFDTSARPAPRSKLALLNVTTSPPVIDTLDIGDGEISRPTLSPAGRWVAYMMIRNGAMAVFVQAYPPSGPPTRVSPGEGLDPLWIDASTLTFREGDVFYKARVDRVGGRVRVDVEEWFQDQQFVDTWLRSQVLTPDGRLIYLRASGQNIGTYLRVVPHWVDQMKRAVDEANR